MFQLRAPGLAPPLQWRIVTGQLPAGLQLDRDGYLHGIPAATGDYAFTVEAMSVSSRAAARRDYRVRVNRPLAVRWTRPPAVNGREIGGEIVVANFSEYDMDLTVIIVSVNQIGRATTLGYQHFNFARAASAERPTEQVIPFSGSPGGGVYVVHADAVGEVRGVRAIYRDRIESPKLSITVVP
jgi:hypothetical protein